MLTTPLETISTGDFRIPETEICQRIASLQASLQKHQIDATLLVQRIDVLYFSGTAQSGYLFIPAAGEAGLFVRRHLPRAVSESPLVNIHPINGLADLPAALKDRYGRLPGSLGLEFDVLPVRTYQYLKKLFPNTGFEDTAPLVHQIRMIKSPWELAQLELTADISSHVFDSIRYAIQPGQTEMELSGIIEAQARKIGHGGGLRCRDFLTDLYSWHILSGSSGGRLGHLDSPASGEGTSVAFPCGAGYKKLAENEPVMIDFGTILNGYHMDETRMFSVGPLPEEAGAACGATIEILQTLQKTMRPGITMDAVFQLAVQTAENLGYAEQFLGPPGCKTSFIGHGVGLELVEPPIVARGREDKLAPGMVLAIEPKMVFENRFCAGIESMVTITDTGCRLLSRVPEEVFIC